MIDTFRVINNLKILTNSKNDSELSTKLGLNQRAVANWKTRNNLNIDKIIKFALENNYSLDLIFKGNLSISDSDKINPIEEFIIFYLKKIKKLDRNNFLNILLNPTIDLLGRCLKQDYSIDLIKNLSQENAKNVLIDLIKRYDLSILIDTELKRKKLIEEIKEEFSNLECYVILKYRDYFL